MKRAIAIMVLGLLLISNIAEAAKSKKTRFKTGQVYEGTVIWEGSVSINLPAGKWKMLGKWDWRVNLILANGLTLALLDDNVLKGLVELTHLDSGGKWTSDIGSWLQEVYMVNKTDGCYERSEYYLVKRYKRGAAFNCLVIRHFEVIKEIYSPDKDILKYQTFNQPFFRVWIKKNNTELPVTMLASEHAFYAPSVRNKVIIVSYLINPELYGASKTEFGTEETSEYHRANINRYPDKKEFMENWVKIATQRHKVFEKDVGAKEIHKLDLSEYVKGEIIEETKTFKSDKSSKDDDIVKKLKDLKELYDSGALTKQEYKKAKKKLLD